MPYVATLYPKSGGFAFFIFVFVFVFEWLGSKAGRLAVSFSLVSLKAFFIQHKYCHSDIRSSVCILV